MKICTACRENKNLSEFYKCKANKDGLKGQCKECMNNCQKKYYKLNREHYIEHGRQYSKGYYLKNRERIKKDKGEYYLKNRDKIAEKTKNNRKYITEYINNRLKTNLNYRLSNCLRSRLRAAIKGKFKSGSAIKDLGCSINYFKKYIEIKFKSGMSWNNWGKNREKWSIDHIRPLSKFDLTDRKQFLEACHYTNLQPMWQIDNIKKRDKIIIN